MWDGVGLGGMGGASAGRGGASSVRGGASRRRDNEASWKAFRCGCWGDGDRQVARRELGIAAGSWASWSRGKKDEFDAFGLGCKGGRALSSADPMRRGGKLGGWLSISYLSGRGCVGKTRNGASLQIETRKDGGGWGERALTCGLENCCMFRPSTHANGCTFHIFCVVDPALPNPTHYDPRMGSILISMGYTVYFVPSLPKQYDTARSVHEC